VEVKKMEKLTGKIKVKVIGRSKEEAKIWALEIDKTLREKRQKK
tara:strand:- start:922 stop:1053 length:132 start_codon:yes stop_codon:yes gene_type:complete